MKTPLKIILKNFLDHVEDLETRRKLNDDQYETEFQELKKLTDALKEDSTYSCSVGLKDVNRPKNRYKDIVPYDFSRVILPKYEGVPGSDYINASYIKGASGAFAYIAAQGPLPNTVIDFWRMIWVCDVQVIVMACNEREAGKFKCEAYWPAPGEMKSYANISIELINTSQVCPDFLIRTFLVKCDSEMRDVYQFHYTSWPDHGIPETVQPILDLVRLMRDCQATETVPIVVHCSAGCGRTGTICAVDYVWACLRHGKLDEDFSLYHIALELRRQRIAMIQTKEQYTLAHKAVAAMFEQQLKVIDCHIYENVDEDGEPLMWKEVRKNKDSDVICPGIKHKGKNEMRLSLSSLKNELPVENIKNSYDGTPTVTSNISSRNSSGANMRKNISDNVISSSKDSESSYSCNSILSQQNTEDSIPFIDDDDVSIRPNCGRAYLNIPSCDSISKLINCFDPFVDKVSLGTDDSSPEGEPQEISNKIKDFQLASVENIVNKTTELTNYKNNASGKEKEMNQFDSKSDIVNYAEKSKKYSLFNNRESYPPCNNFEKFKGNETGGLKSEVSDSTEEMKGAKKIGKATVVRRPSISKLKALFEKSGLSQKSSNDGSKRLLFRNNSHHVSRAGSAPPSLNCMDKSSAVEKESILMIVTRKFRSSSVRTERELQSQHNVKTLNRRSATDTVKDGLNALTRTMSFNLNKTFKSYSPSKPKVETSMKNTSNYPSCSTVGTYKPKSPDSQKGNSMWYDKSSLPRAVAIVKPTGKYETNSEPKIPPKSPFLPKSPDKEKSEPHFSFSSKPAKLRDLFSSLNRKDTKESATFWYESNLETETQTEKQNPETDAQNDNANLVTKPNKVLPFLPSNPFKKVNQKSPLSSPDSPKGLGEPTAQQNSKFYTNVHVLSPDISSDKKHIPEVPVCPVPEEIIPLTVDPSNNFWPSPPVKDPEQIISENNSSSSVDVNIPITKESVSVQPLIPESEKNENCKNPVMSDIPPAIPKKMIIGKSKHFQNSLLDKNTDVQCLSTEKPADHAENTSNSKILNDDQIKSNVLEGKSDLYINVNIKAMKNIEQIENTLRKNPRAAIIDLTSRKSYSMEEELVNAVQQLSEDDKSSSILPALPVTESKTSVPKNNTKFPGYEVIWPDHKNIIPVQKSKSNCKVAPSYKIKSSEKCSDNSLYKQKTGLCYSPPLRRSANASLALAKSQSCGNLDWLEPDDAISGLVSLKDQSNTPTKRLVNEAVVELNTLLNQLTTKTLSEDIEFNSKEKLAENKSSNSNEQKSNANNTETSDTVMHSVTLVTKSYNSGSSPKEEEIVFHFPPPPRVPPPKDEQPVESFQILRKNGSLVVKEKSKTENTATQAACANIKIKAPEAVIHENSAGMPQPAPRKSKQTSPIRRSSSYTNISLPQNKNKGYENVFLEKYQTLSRLQIKPEFGECNILDKPVPLQKPVMLKNKSDAKKLPNYVNISDVHISCIPGESNLSKSMVEPIKESACITAPASDVKPTFVSSKMVIDNTKDESVYGKIYKISEKKTQIIKNPQNVENIVSSKSLLDAKKKPIPSKKTERAPAPPGFKQIEDANLEMIDSNSSMIPKKLPSRKLEKAPPPPHSLQKSSSAMIVPKQNLQTAHQYANFSHQIESKHKLPAVHENVSNSVEPPKMNKNIKSAVFNDKFISRGLSHSQSDVSVFLALKERRAQSAVQGHKVLNMKSVLMNKTSKQKNETVNISSSDSDSSYEKIFLSNKDDKEPSSKLIPKEQTVNMTPRSYKKEMPIAPPRSKRRSTTEVQYTKVKAKDASLTVSSQIMSGENKTKDSKSDLADSVDKPPAIPLKSKDAFEIPGDCQVKDMNKSDEIQGSAALNHN